MHVTLDIHTINRGSRRDGKRCPIALALIAAGVIAPNVGSRSVLYLDHTGTARQADLPEVARQWRSDYDGWTRDSAKPMEFDIDIKTI